MRSNGFSAGLGEALEMVGTKVIGRFKTSARGKSDVVDSVIQTLEGMSDTEKIVFVGTAVTAAGSFKLPPKFFAEFGPFGSWITNLINEVMNESLVATVAKGLTETSSDSEKLAAFNELKTKVGGGLKSKITASPPSGPILEVLLKIEHSSDACPDFAARKSAWDREHPLVRITKSAPKGGGSTTEEKGGELYPFSSPNFEQRMRMLGITTCGTCCDNDHEARRTGSAAAPEKAKDWRDQYNPDYTQRMVFLKMYFEEKLNKADVLEYLSAVNVSELKATFDRFSSSDKMRLEDKKYKDSAGNEVTEHFVPAIVGLMKAATDKFNTTALDEISGVLKSWTEKINPVDPSKVMDGFKEVVAEVENSKIAYGGVALFGLFLLAWLAYIVGWVVGHPGPLIVGTFTLPIVLLITSRIPKGIDWVMDQFRAILRKFVPSTPFVDSFLWFYNLCMDGVTFVAILGLACWASIEMWGGGFEMKAIISRLIVAAGGLILIVRAGHRARWHFATRAYSSAEKTDTVLSWIWPILLVGGIILFPGSCQKWQTLEGTGKEVDVSVVYTQDLLVAELPFADVFRKDVSKVRWNQSTEEYSTTKEVDIKLPGAIVRSDEGRGKYTYKWKSNLLVRLANTFIGQAIGADDWVREMYMRTEKKEKKDDNNPPSTQSVGQHMLGCTHMFWFVFVVIGLAAALIGFVTLMVMGAEEPTLGASKKRRGFWIGLAIAAILGGLFVASVVGIPLGIDRIFEIGEPEETTQQEAVQLVPVILAIVPTPATQQVVPTPAKPEGKARGDTGQKRAKRLDCSKYSSVNRQSCLDAQR